MSKVTQEELDKLVRKLRTEQSWLDTAYDDDIPYIEGNIKIVCDKIIGHLLSQDAVLTLKVKVGNDAE